MLLLRRSVSALLTLWLLLVVSAQSTLACTGETAPLATGIRGATSVYYARIVAASQDSTGFFDLRLQVGPVLRGKGLSHVSRIIPNEACQPLDVGDSGVVVLGSVDPFGVGPTDLYNFFYVIGPGRTSRAEATAILSVPPPTHATALVDHAGGGQSLRLFIVATSAIVSFLFAAGHLRRRQSGDRSPVQSDPSTVRPVAPGIHHSTTTPNSAKIWTMR